MPWSTPFEDPIDLSNCRQLITLQEAADYIMKLPKTEQNRPGVANRSWLPDRCRRRPGLSDACADRGAAGIEPARRALVRPANRYRSQRNRRHTSEVLARHHPR